MKKYTHRTYGVSFRVNRPSTPEESVLWLECQRRAREQREREERMTRETLNEAFGPELDPGKGQECG